MKKDGLVYTIIFSFIITFIFVFMLSMSHELTKDKVAAYNSFSEKRAILSAFNIKISDEKEVLNTFKNKVKIKKINEKIVYYVEIDNQSYYAKKFSGNGLWGTITGILAVNQNATRIYGLEILTHNETPGLGGRIEEDWFLKQFNNEAIIENKIAINTKGTGKGDYETDNGRLDAITGATQTTNFLEKIVNNEIIKVKKLLRESHE